MKKRFVLFSLLAAAAASANAQQLGVDYPELKLPSGRVLLHTRVTKFDGEKFEIENSNGTALIYWTSMPVDWQAKFPRDAARAQEIEVLKRKVAVLTALQAQSRNVQTSTPSPTSAPRSAFGTEMELPRYNMETTTADLKVGIKSDKVLRILGNPLRINGTQWVYARGYIYIENGVVTAMQNRAGGVFAADWK